MNIEAVPASLRERLGPEATGGLLDLCELEYRERKADVIGACTERFERRLAEEMAVVRVQIAQVEAALRYEMGQMDARIRQDMAGMGASIRQDMALMGASIRQETAQMGAGIRQDMGLMGGEIRKDIAYGRVELFKWCFLFWIGQVLAIAGVMGVMLRLVR